MKSLFLRALLMLPVFFLMPAVGHADEPKLSPERLDLLDQRGYFTRGFKAAVHDYIDTKQALEQAGSDQKKLADQLPGLQKQRDDAEAQTDALRKELDAYQHPEILDFGTLQDRMKDPAAKPEDLLPLAQAFLWTYPTDPHADEARQDLQQIQKKLADQQQAVQDALAAKAAAQAKLLQRVQNRDLSLSEWKDFLRDKSQEDILKYLGRPDVAQTEYWIYKSAYTVDPDTGQKVGLEIDYNGTRVNSVTAGPVAP